MKKVKYGIVILLFAIINSSCSDNSTGTKNNNGDAGSLKVTITTEGPDSDDYDQDGYKLSIENHSQQVSTQDNLTMENLSTGIHIVELNDLASNCELTNETPIEVEISSGSITNLDLKIKCNGVLQNRIIYLSYISDKPLAINNSKIVSIDPNGSDKKVVKNDPKHYDDVVFSPDGTKIAYSTDSGISIINSENGENIYHFGGSEDYGPEFSPDGITIVYTSGIGYDSRTYLLNLNKGWPPKNLLAQIGHDYHMQITPTFSPNGKEVAFAGQAYRQDPSEFNIFLQKINDDSAPIKLTQTGNNRNPAFIDSTHIVYQSTKRSNGEEYTNIEMVNVKTKKITELTSGKKFNDYSPITSPNENKIAFIRHKVGSNGNNIYLINLNQNDEVIKLTAFKKGIGLGDFSPNGNSIVFTKENVIYKVDTKGNMNVVQLTNNSFPNTSPRWSPAK